MFGINLLAGYTPTPVQQVGMTLKTISLILFPVLLAASVIGAFLLLMAKKHGQKNILPEKFDEQGMYTMGDPNLRNNFVSIRKENNELVIVAGEYTQSAFITIINFSNKGKRSNWRLDFSKGRTIRIPLSQNTDALTIVCQSINGKKVPSIYAVNPSKGTNAVVALLPTICATICCYFQTIYMTCMMDVVQFDKYTGVLYYVLSGIPLVVGFPVIFIFLNYLSNKVRK